MRALRDQAADVAAVLRVFASEVRLLLFCKLIESREASVNELAEHVGLSSAALSLHLSKMRLAGLVTFRREGQISWHRIHDPAVKDLISTSWRLSYPRTKTYR